MDDVDFKEMLNISLIKVILRTLQESEKYSKPKILDLLASFCTSNDNIVHVNQDTIFHLLTTTNEYTNCFIKIEPKDEQLLLTFDGL